MKFLMINSPLYRDPKEYYDDVLPPIWLWYMCTNLKKKWIPVELFDSLAWKVPLEKIIDYIEYWDYTHVWLNIFSTNKWLVENIVSRVSKEITFLIWWSFTKSSAKDIVEWNTKNQIEIIIGEWDTIVWDIVTESIQEKPIFETENRRIFKVDKNSIYFPKDLSTLDLDRTLFEYEPTINNKTQKKEGNIIVSRGCIYDCAFCSAAISLNTDVRVRERSIEHVRDEINQIKNLYPDVQSIRVLDDLFLKNAKSVEKAIQIFSWLNLEWRAMAHIQSFKNISDEQIISMKQAGCDELSIGIESWSNEILVSINKKNTVLDIKETIERILKGWIWVKGYFIIWFPNETKKNFKETYELVIYLKELSIYYGSLFRVSVFQFRPYNGTQLYYNLIESGHKIWDIWPTEDIGLRKIGEYDFSSWNYSSAEDKDVKEYIEKIRSTNDIYESFLPYINTMAIEENSIFFVWLSHKSDKDKNVLDAFCTTTASWKLIHSIKNQTETSIHLANLVKWVPLDKDNKIRYPSDIEKQIWLRELKNEILIYKPTKIFLFGKQVSDVFMKDQDIEKIHETLYKFQDTYIISVEHPSFISVYKRDYIEQYCKNILYLIDDIS